ncbi:spore cortex biosynthesis protein YabQ [Sediminibacillus dalangtanensis]|uniref:Spore cortex biosynthesis protein YabQ n=1 Tax=Sediminibacillus dalangtanensis TaxID=2729421 RepID=A0ABX7VXJ5_9BACI|nr:spore cortex biosynthesis protein YabQ [Sediminibacillus dalangtanensis]QTN01274.1 spore cortex biosynthesis protein YabQ [Sediminibacillus dalangtanensis]
MTLSVQFAAILLMMAGGVYVGAAIDTFRRFERSWKHRVLFSYGMEISFWLLQTLILFYLLYKVNQGELRFYIFLALLCGFATYKALFEHLYQRLLEKLIGFLIALYRFFARLFNGLIIQPIIWLFRLLLMLLTGIGTVLIWLLTVIGKVCVFPFRLLLQLIWMLLPKAIKKYLHTLAGFYSKIKNMLRKWRQFMHKKRR